MSDPNREDKILALTVQDNNDSDESLFLTASVFRRHMGNIDIAFHFRLFGLSPENWGRLLGNIICDVAEGFSEDFVVTKEEALEVIRSAMNNRIEENKGKQRIKKLSKA